MNQALLYKTVQKQFDQLCKYSNEAFDKYQEKRKVLGLAESNLVYYAEAGAYDNAARMVQMIADINGIPLIERVTKYENDRAFDQERYDCDKADVRIEETELQEV